MKNILKTLVFGLLLALTSCETNEEKNNIQTQQGKTIIQNALLEKGFTFTESSIGKSATTSARSAQSSGEIYGIYLNNGQGEGCRSNILVFDSWSTYHNTIDYLDEQIEIEADAFDATVPAGTSDEDYEALADAAGFDEDNPLINFESELRFCSLRRKLLSLEDEWLGQQGDGQWNMDEDPDNHFIEDDTERALLGFGVDVFIYDREKGLVYYHFIDDDGGYIMVFNMDEVAIKDIVNGNIPVNNPNVQVVEPPKPESNENCKTKIRFIRMEANPWNRIKCKSKVINTDSWGKKKIFASTKGYIKKRGGWKLRKSWISAGITDSNGIYAGSIFNQCTTDFPLYANKTKRRKKVKTKITGNYFENPTSNSLKIGIKDNKVFSYHKQGTIDKKDDYYDMPSE